MVVKPIEFAMIQQQNAVAKEQHNTDTRPMTQQQGIYQQIERSAEVQSQQVNKQDNADNNNGNYDAREKSNNEYHKDKGKEKKEKSDGRVFVKGQGSTDFDVKI